MHSSAVDCNQLFVGVTGRLLGKLQSLQNADARLVTGARKFDRITPVMRELHWLAVRQRIRDSRSGLQVPPWTDQPTCARCLFCAQGQPMATGVLLSVDQSRGSLPVALRSSDVKEETFRRHFCLSVLTISYVDSYRDIDSYVTILPSLPT